MRIYHSLLIAALLGISNLGWAQKTVTGKVFDAGTREPLSGVAVLIPHSQSGTATDSRGAFSVSSPHKIDSVQIYMVGYVTQTIVHPESELNIALEPAVHSLQTVIVSADRDKQERKDIPATINTISSQVILETNPTQLNQVLNKVPGLVMKDLNNEQHMMSIRQPMTSRPYFLYLEDGLPIAPVGNFNHNQLIEINMLGIRTVEVIKGPASSIYGSNAVGGTVNFITRSPTVLPTARVGYQQSNHGYQRMEFFASNYITQKFGLSVGGYMARQRDGWQAYSDFDKFSLSAKGVYHVNEQTHLTGYLTANSLDTQTGGSIDSVGFYSQQYLANNDFAYRKVNSLRGRITLDHYRGNTAKTSVSVYSGKNSIDQNPRYRIRDINRYSASGQENSDNYENYGMLVQHSESLGFLGSKLIGGIQSNYAPTNYWAKYGEITRDSTTGYYSNFQVTDSLLADYRIGLTGTGAYLQYEFNPFERLKLVAGARADYLSYIYRNSLSKEAYSGVPDTTLSNFAFSPKLGVTYDFSNGSGLYANYSKGFAPPQTSDLFFGTKVPVLKPAYFTNYEAGFWTVLFRDKFYADISVYRLEGKDEIITVRLADNSTEFRNSGKTLHEGIEYSLTYRPVEDIFFRVGGTYASHRYVDYTIQEKADGQLISYDGKDMPEAPKFITNAELTLKPRFIKGFHTSLEWQYIGPWYKDDANLYRYDDKTFMLRGTSILTLRTAYRYKQVELYCHILNLTNELYANSVTRGSNMRDNFAAGAPRTFVFGFTYNLEREK